MYEEMVVTSEAHDRLLKALGVQREYGAWAQAVVDLLDKIKDTPFRAKRSDDRGVTIETPAGSVFSHLTMLPGKDALAVGRVVFYRPGGPEEPTKAVPVFALRLDFEGKTWLGDDYKRPSPRVPSEVMRLCHEILLGQLAAAQKQLEP
jgi:hypothetical protein